jgi:hypothetical protein
VSPCHSNKEHHHCPSLVTSQSLWKLQNSLLFIMPLP